MQFCMLLLYALKINTGKFMITTFLAISFCGLFLFPYSLTFTQGQIILETFFVPILPNRVNFRPLLGATTAPNLGLWVSWEKFSLEIVKNDIDLEGATRQNVLIFRKYASKNAPMPPMCKIGPVQQGNYDSYWLDITNVCRSLWKNDIFSNVIQLQLKCHFPVSVFHIGPIHKVLTI